MNTSSLIGHVTELLQLIENSKQPADKISSSFFRERKYLGAKDRRFISEAVFGIIRNRRYVEALLEQYLIEHPAHGELDEHHHRFLALYTAFAATLAGSADATPDSLWKTIFPKIPPSSFTEWISVHASLDFLPDDRLIRLGVKYSFQDWMVEKFSQQSGDDVEKLLQAFNTPSNITLRVNLLKTTRDECQQRLLKEGIETTFAQISPAGLIAKKRFSVQSSPSFNDGWFEMQDEGSQIISLIANPAPGEIVVDACAGAGGKSLHLAELMKDAGEIIAIDVDRKRLAELQSRTRRAGIQAIHAQHRDELFPENFSAKADIVLVDAPCSGAGTIRRNPGMKWSITESLVSHFAEKQREILSFNAQFVKPGGKLLYVTCSLFREENEDVVEKFLANFSDFERITEDGRPSDYGMLMHDGMVKLFPHVHNTDGFFIAVMKRLK